MKAVFTTENTRFLQRQVPSVTFNTVLVALVVLLVGLYSREGVLGKPTPMSTRSVTTQTCARWKSFITILQAIVNWFHHCTTANRNSLMFGFHLGTNNKQHGGCQNYKTVLEHTNYYTESKKDKTKR